MKKEKLVFIIMTVIFVLFALVVLIEPEISDSKNDNQNTADIVYTDEYKESVRQEVIKELYGSREAYASEKTGSRADYVDKEASKNGELVVDENRMNQVYESKLKEFDSNIDNDKVDKIVSERLEQLVDTGAYNEVGESSKVSSRKVMYWKNGGKYFALIILAGMLIIFYFKKCKK